MYRRSTLLHLSVLSSLSKTQQTASTRLKEDNVGRSEKDDRGSHNRLTL